MGKWKYFAILGLALLVLVTLSAGIYFHHYFVLGLFSAWIAAELILWRFYARWKGIAEITSSRFHSLSSLLWLYGKIDTVNEHIVNQKILELNLIGTLTEPEKKWLERLRDLVVLKNLAFGPASSGKKGLRQAFILNDPSSKNNESKNKYLRIDTSVSFQDITESANYVADLYWKLYDTASGGYPELTIRAKELYSQIFGGTFQVEKAHSVISKVTDAMQRDQGIPFLLLSLVNNRDHKAAREINQRILTEGIELDLEGASPIYWLCEITWFVEEGPQLISDFESTIRYLYHLCFVNPGRAGFLEIDSQFFSQFEVVSELSQEALLFREVLIEKIFDLWRTQEGPFDSVFRHVLEVMTNRASKIYDNRESWEIFWNREKSVFDRDYLYVVEGNLSYAKGRYDDAKICYEKALKINPNLRSALLNLVFCYARLRLNDKHQELAQKITSDRSLQPAALFVAGNSYLLVGNEEEAERYYSMLTEIEGWDIKIDYYKSTFCYENGLFALALRFAKKAHHLNPNDASTSYNLSLCYNAVGEKERALDLLQVMPESPEWLNYYRFTLERDSGRLHEASNTLLNIPQDYFEDPEELEAALDFARHRQDLVLLRHLRRKE